MRADPQDAALEALQTIDDRTSIFSAAGGDYCREPQEILDACTRAGLATRYATVEHGNGQAIGGCVDSRRKSCRAGADDCDDVHVRGIEDPRQDTSWPKSGFRRTVTEASEHWAARRQGALLAD